MALLRKCLIGLGLLLLAAGLLLWFLPARWVTPAIEARLPGIHLQEVGGTVWEGCAATLMDTEAKPLGHVSWQLSRKLLLGRLQLRVNFQGPEVTLAGSLRKMDADHVELRDVHLVTPVNRLQSHVPEHLGQPLGELQLTLERAVLRGGWPLQLEGRGRWLDAAMRTDVGDVPLGVLAIRAEAQAGIVQLHLHDSQSGPLQADLQLQLSTLGWRLQGSLAARGDNPLLQHWLRQLGSPGSDGRVLIDQRGGLSMASTDFPKAKS